MQISNHKKQPSRTLKTSLMTGGLLGGLFIFICAFAFTVVPTTTATAATPSDTADTAATVDTLTAAPLIQDAVEFYKAEVTAILKEEQQPIPGTAIDGTFQTLEVRLKEGPKAGETVIFTDDYTKHKKGDTIYVRHTIHGETGREVYSAEDFNRMPLIYFLTGLFVLLVVLIGGVQGVRGLLSLVGSLLLILFVLLPQITAGHSPIIVSLIVSSFIIVLGSYVTHGFNKTTSSAVFGMILTVIVTGALAFWAVKTGRFTGFGSEEVTYLNLNSRGSIDIIGIFLSSIMIGLLGVLYDVAIGQAVSVEELHTIAPHASRRTVYARVLRMGREHIGALVNTLAIAYVGAALPLLLLFTQTHAPGEVLFTINREFFSEEIIRILVGSIGLVLAVPITTLIAVMLLMKKSDQGTGNQKSNEDELPPLSHGHSHGYGHGHL